MGEFDEILSGLKRTSEKIRALDQAGVPKKRIAEILGIEENHVYSTISRDRRVKRAKLTDGHVHIDSVMSPGATTSGGSAEESYMLATVNERGELVLSPEVVETLDMPDGEQVIVMKRKGELLLMSWSRATELFTANVRRVAPSQSSLAEILLSAPRATVKR